MEVRGTPVTINGRTAGVPGPAPGSAAAPLRVQIPYPLGRAPSPTATTFSRQLTITNLDGANALRVYIGTDAYVTVPALGEKVFNGAIVHFAVQSNAVAAVQWEAVAIVAA